VRVSALQAHEQELLRDKAFQPMNRSCDFNPTMRENDPSYADRIAKKWLSVPFLFPRRQ
jgi:hypothetical protein